MLFAFFALEAFRSFKGQSKIREVDSALPAALFSIASFPRGAPFDKVLLEVAASTPRHLRVLLQDASGCLASGMAFPLVMARMRSRCPSALLARVTGLLESAYGSGADLSGVYRKVAEDAYEFSRLEAERAQAFAVQKYTLFSGVVVVPALLGFLFSWASGDSPFTQAVFLGFQVYLFFFGLLASLFIAVVEGSPKRWLSYAIFLVPVAFIVFHGVRML